MNRAVFLDRDGVLNRTHVRDGAPRAPTLADFELLPDVPAALQRLAALGLRLIVVTNQPDVARRRITHQDVEAIHERLVATLPLAAVYVCYHDDVDACDCRKPRPGMLQRGAAEHGVDLAQSFMVGDRWCDVEAGRAAGCETFLLERPYSEHQRCAPDHVVTDLAAAAQIISTTIRGSHA